MTTPEQQDLLPKTVDRPDLAPTTRKKFPRKFDERHDIAFNVYVSLGPTRTYKDVAVKMGVSETTIGTWAVAYGWKEKLQDELKRQREIGLIEHFGEIASIRGDGIFIVSSVMRWMRSITEIIEKAREAGRNLTPEENEKIEVEKNALKACGLSLKSPKDFRDLVNIVAEVIDFQPGSGGGSVKTQASEDKPLGGNVHVDGPCLIIQGLEPEKAKEVINGALPVLQRGA